MAILPSNAAQLRRAVEAVRAAGKHRVGVVGLAFKAGTDDLRESPMVALVEALVGRGFDVRIVDGNVAVARLHRLNRRFVEKQIPHPASLMCESVEALLDHAEVLVIGSANAEAEHVLAGARPPDVVVDLSRGARGGTGPPRPRPDGKPSSRRGQGRVGSSPPLSPQRVQRSESSFFRRPSRTSRR